MVLCDLYLKRFDLTKGLLFETFVITVWYKLCRCDHSVHQEITLVYICQIRMRLYVIKSLNDMYMSNNF